MQTMLRVFFLALPMVAVACGENATFTERTSKKNTGNGSQDANATPGVTAAGADGGGTGAVPGGGTDPLGKNGTDQANNGPAAGGGGTGAPDAGGGDAGGPAADGGSDLGAADGSATATEAKITALCNAKAAQMQAVTRAVAFADPGKVCDWGKDGNGQPKDGEIRARREQAMNLEIPDKAIVCDMRFRFTEQDMRFDDEIYLTFNNIVLAGSMDYTARFDKDDKYPVYDWTKQIGASYGHAILPTYCLGAKDGLGECFIPPTETKGTMNLKFDVKLVRDLVARAIKAKKYELKFTTLGDNDDADCRHLDFGFNVDISYVTP